MLIKNGNVFLAEKNKFEVTDILVKDGIIKKVSKNINAQEENEDNIINVSGNYVLPGFIDAHSHIGLWEEGLNWEGDDGCEYSSPITPGVRGIDSINPFDIAFKEALKGGVTTVCSGPGSANVIGGQFSTISLYGNVIDEMVITEIAALKCAFGENPKVQFGKNGNLPVSRMGIAYVLRKALYDAKNYMNKKEKEFDLDKEVLVKVLKREIPLKIHVHRADDICTAIRIGKEFNIKVTLDHCTEGHLIADYIKKSEYPAIVGPSLGSKSKIEIKEKRLETARILNEKGIKIAITTDHNVIPQGELRICAARSHFEGGLNEIEALKAITIYPAEILEIDGKKGVIKEGKDADIVIWDSHPFDLKAKAQIVYVNGKEVYNIKNDK
jgi:imidazolonepropionase-like amidohydrolase